MYKLNLKLIKALSLVYIYFLIFTLYFTYIIKVNKVFIKVINYLINYYKGISNIKFILSI